MQNFESAFQEVCKLTEDFKKNESSYLSPSYMEAEVRRDFIDKFFEALGWDVYHRQQKNPYEQEVKVEKGVSVGRAQKRADYAFFISPDFRSPKFFAEAKKPVRNLKNPDDYFQTIRYGWNANTPVALLTDFQEFHILDCRIKPNINTVLDNPSHKSYYFEDYTDTEKFSEIFYLFSRDAVAGGSLEKYAGSLAKPKGKAKAVSKSVQAIDEDFLEYIDGVRERLAKAFKKNDESLSSEELTEATQRTIDRLVFIRFLEDKLIEPQNIISEFGRRGNAYNDFISASRSLDSKYNGIVFKEHFIDRKDSKGPDEAEFKKTCDEFSHLNSPYDFNAIPVHIIGSIYERFLGKVVNATAHRVKVEEKPEVRKAGGVYYTPKYIVDYIVENTVGKILRNETDTSVVPGRSGILPDESPQDSDSIPQDILTVPLRKGKEENIAGDDVPLRRGIKGEATGKTPAEISKLRFADIACGSGSFLIGVFETLLKYHTEYYNRNPEQARKDGCIEKDGAFILSIKQKQKILRNNIYGVDIDLQAVEVTQLSLALKMLEDETTATANEMQVLFHEKILPDLSKNIVCGNSLIGTDILEGKMFESCEERKLNPMDFETTFPSVFCHSREGGNPLEDGGFDAIVGNPPYVKEYTDKSAFDYVKKSKLKSYYQGKMDLWYFFACYGLDILKDNGYLGLIVPNNWVTNAGASILRNKIITDGRIMNIVDFGDYMVFRSASIQTSIIIISKNNKDNHYYFNFSKFINRIISHQDVYDILLNKSNENFISYSPLINRENLKNKYLIFGSSDKENILLKIANKSNFKLDSNNEVAQGIVPNPDIVSSKAINKIPITKRNKFNISVSDPVFVIPIEYFRELNDKEKLLIKPLFEPKDINRYYFPSKYNKQILYINRTIEVNHYTNIINHLEKYREIMEDRRETKNGRIKYYQLHWPRTEKYFSQGEKIISIRKCKYPVFTYTNNEAYFMMAFNVILSKRINLKYLLAILNSKLIAFWLKYKGKMQGSNYQIDKEPLIEIPIFLTNNILSHDKIVTLVEQILEAKKQLHNSKTEKDKIYFERKCDSLDKQIDAEVYKLYGLTEDEIKIVEDN